MDLQHSFTVPASVEETWAAFNDIESVAACFPGATVTEVEGDTFTGTCKVKLGPIAMLYRGSGTFLERDETGHRMVLEATGKDKRGNGTAGATVTLSLVPVGGAAGASPDQGGHATEVQVATDLAITGKPAQFGRGVIQDVSDKLLAQFTDCLEGRVGAGSSDADSEQPTEQPPPAAAQQAAAPPAPPAAAASAAGTPDPTTPAGPADHAEAADARSGDDVQEEVSQRPGRAQERSDDALDLGSTVLPVLARAYWKHAVVVIVVIIVLVWLLS